MTRWLGIALLPDNENTQRAIALQSAVGGRTKLVPEFSTEGNLPHVTLYQGPLKERFTDRYAKGLLAHVRRSLASTGSLSVQGSGIHYQSRGWIFQGLEHETILFHMQDTVVSEIEPYIDLDNIDRTRDVASYSPHEVASYFRYGYRYVHDAFRPHITLGRCDEALAKGLVQAAVNNGLGSDQWHFDRLSCYLMGEDGAHTAIVVAETLADDVAHLQT